MRRSTIPLAMFAILTLSLAARAQEAEVTSPRVTNAAATTNALEVGVALGSAQGLGDVTSGGPTLDPIGWGADVTAGWRLNPRWMVGGYGSFGTWPSGGTRSTSTAAGVQAQYHFATRFQPWVGLGTGWRGYWASGGGNYQGLDLLRVQAGLGIPVTPNFSLEPMVSATLATFLGSEPSARFATASNDVRPSLFFFTGIVARFDLFGHAESPRLVASR